LTIETPCRFALPRKAMLCKTKMQGLTLGGILTKILDKQPYFWQYNY